MDDYNNAAQNTDMGRRQPSNMTNTVTRTPQRRRPNTAYDGHDYGQQQHTVNANHDGYPSFVNNQVVLGRDMETHFPSDPWPSNFGPQPGLQPSAPQCYNQMNEPPLYQAMKLHYEAASYQDMLSHGGQGSRQSLSQHPSSSQMFAPQLPPTPVYYQDQCISPEYHQPSEGYDINEANGATAVDAARPSQQACRQGRVKTSRPTASHDVADSNTEYAATDHENDKDSNDTPDIRKQKRYQKNSEDQEPERDPKTGRFRQVCNLRKQKKKGRPDTKPEEVYENFTQFCLRKGINLKTKDVTDGESNEGFEYNKDGQLQRKTFSTEDIREIVRFKIEESQKSKVPPKNSKEPPKKDFTMWIQSAPCQAGGRLNRRFDQDCRWKLCPVTKRTVRPGQFRVAFDELPNFTGKGLVDPLKPALVLHLRCFEEVFSREETQKYLTDGVLKGDRREFEREDRNIVRLDKDGKDHSRTIIEEWRKATYKEQEAIAQKIVDAKREADARNNNSGSGDCEFYQEPTYSAGHLASLTFALTAWYTDQNTKYRTMDGNGTRARKRNERNKKRPKGIRATFDYSFGDIEYYKKAKEGQQNYSNKHPEKKDKAPSKQGARTKQEDTEHRDSSDDPETKLLQAKERPEEAKKRLDEAEEKRDAQKHVPKKKSTKKKGKRNDPAAQTAVEEASESLETTKRDCRRAPKERSSAKDTDAVEESPRSIQQSAKSHATAYTDDLGERSGNEPAKGNSEPSYNDGIYYTRSICPCSWLPDANGVFEGENLYALPGTAGQGQLVDNKNLNCPGSLVVNQGEWLENCYKTQESVPIVFAREDALLWQESMSTPTFNASMSSTQMPTAWALQSRVLGEAPDSDEDGPFRVKQEPSQQRVLGEAPDSDEDGPLRVKQEPSQQRVLEEAPDSDEDGPLRVKQEPSQQRGLQELPDYNNNISDRRTVPSRVAAPRKRGQRQISDYNDAEEAPSTKRARIAAPQQVSNAAAACHTPSYGPNRPARNKRRADGDLDDSSHKRMCQ
ncbi:hypothetical protein H634G_06236 [Metarhizium anisopliae BRIP 53293]|uniref:Uncharacterized protein n=1 Tax=Metarhizium anisopliae BRIP 53293 TaxID=1291518 RepID=A0A0D9NXJ3_METAN|nr:hypothetical protein H634G_06236 [Metarhizium anisopliae BRIP 53293]